MTIVPVTSEVQRSAARELVAEYLHWIAEGAWREYGLAFDVAAMLESDLSDREKFHPPHGRFYLVQDGEAFAGVGCLKRLEPRIGEIQRMYVRPACRGKGFGRAIVERLIEDARQIGYRKLRLESLKFLAVAHALYRSVGFVEIDPYARSSMEKYCAPEAADAYRVSVVFMEMAI